MDSFVPFYSQAQSLKGYWDISMLTCDAYSPSLLFDNIRRSTWQSLSQTDLFFNLRNKGVKSQYKSTGTWIVLTILALSFKYDAGIQATLVIYIGKWKIYEIKFTYRSQMHHEEQKQTKKSYLQDNQLQQHKSSS